LTEGNLATSLLETDRPMKARDIRKALDLTAWAKPTAFEIRSHGDTIYAARN
jgi:hypothetical protein